jgi:uncharacterized protein (DUF2252 family)
VPADPIALVKTQLERDRARTKDFPQLLARKIARMRASALGFLRGSAPLFYDLLKARPELADGPAGEGWLCGDLHVENFGAYRPDEERVVFDVNDFDDAMQAPWRLDVVRLATSLILLARSRGQDGAQALALAEKLAAAHSIPRVPPPPEAVQKLIDRAKKRTRKQLLDARTEIAAGKRRFVRGPRYESLSSALAKEAQAAFAAYAGTDESCAICDVAFRIAGTGSLGGLRIAVLTSGRGGKDGHWIFDMKEEAENAQRVVDAMKACLDQPPRMAGTTRLGKRSMLVRRLAPQEDKLDLLRVDPAELESLAAFLGAKAGAAHRRGGGHAVQWKAGDVSRLVASASELAGIHESCYLAFCRLTTDSARG